MTIRPALPVRRPVPVRHLLAAILPVAAASIVGSAAVLPNLGWYHRLHLPTFAPPTFVLPIVWTVIHALMAWAFFRVLERPAWMPDRPAAIRAFVLQIVLDVLWPFAFFAAHRPKVGLAVLVLLLVAMALCGRRFAAVDRKAGWLFFPCGLWTAFAFLINLSIVIRN